MVDNLKKGHLNPITQVIYEVVEAFRELGFEVADGPEVEDEFHNFDALNVPADHPSRDMQDTFWLKDFPLLLRTQTSAVQARFMEKNKPPFKILAPGKCFRQEATDARHEAQLHQIEGLLVDHHVNVSHLKGYLDKFFQKLYGPKAHIRLRPSYFPFVEPGFEADMACFSCNQTGKMSDGRNCPLCGGGGWIEIGGTGMVHPKVLKNMGFDPNEWSGFAFGFGGERLAMLKWGIEDTRIFFNGDLRFIDQF